MRGKSREGFRKGQNHPIHSANLQGSRQAKERREREAAAYKININGLIPVSEEQRASGFIASGGGLGVWARLIRSINITPASQLLQRQTKSSKPPLVQRRSFMLKGERSDQRGLPDPETGLQ